MRFGKHRFVILVYPFQYRDGLRAGIRRRSTHRSRSAAGTVNCWLPWWYRLDRQVDSTDEELSKAVSDGYFFLPFVRSLLFPETDWLEESSLESQVREAVRRRAQGIRTETWIRELPSDAVLHLTLDQSTLGFFEGLLVSRGRQESGCPLWIEWCDTLLFPQGVGFLLLKVVPLDGSCRSDDWVDLLGMLTHIHSPYPGWVSPDLSLPTEEGALRFTISELVDFLLQEWTIVEPSDEWLEPRAYLGRPPAADRRYTSLPRAHVYGAYFHLYAYGCLEGRNPPSACEQPFRSEVERVLFHLGTGISPSREEGLPHADRVEQLRKRNIVAFWDNWQGIVLPDRVVFLGTRESEFTRTYLPWNVEGEYLYLYIFTLFQKLRLSFMNGELLRRERGSKHHRRESKRLWDEFLRFQNLYWYSEVTPREQGKALYARFQAGLDVHPLCDQMKEEVRELHQYYERRYEGRISSLLNFLTFIGLPVGLWVSLFGPALLSDASEKLQTSWTLAGSTGFAMLGGALLFWLFWKRYS